MEPQRVLHNISTERTVRLVASIYHADSFEKRVDKDIWIELYPVHKKQCKIS
jgi:hypothetical protein